MEKIKTKFSSPVLASAIKGTLIAVAISLILILIFALIIKFVNVPENFIMPVNQAIKIISIFLGCMLGLKNMPQKGLITGLLIGVMYSILAFLVFSLLSGSFAANINLLVDTLFAGIIGAICGVMAVNKKRM